jgi:DNA repair ATPase RecN
MSTALAVTPLSVTEARALTERINATAGELCLLLVEAHDREAWRALGYDSWRDYATAELQVSQARAYQILDHGRITLALAGAVADEGNDDFSTKVEITERAARDIKPILPEVVQEVKARVKKGADPVKVVREVVQEAREIVGAIRPDADPEPDMLAELEAAHRELEQLRGEVDALTKDDRAAEVRRLSAKAAQLNANNMGLQRTVAELRAQTERQGKTLTRVRKALGVEKDSEIVPAISALQG